VRLKKLKIILSQQEVHQAWLQGGYPEPALSQDANFFEYRMAKYQKLTCFAM